MDDLTLDGNAMAGLLAEALAGDPTTMRRRCDGCGADHELGAHRAYRSAGVVLRCPGCEQVAVVIGVLGDRLSVQVRGTVAIRRP